MYLLVTFETKEIIQPNHVYVCVCVCVCAAAKNISDWIKHYKWINFHFFKTSENFAESHKVKSLLFYAKILFVRA